MVITTKQKRLYQIFLNSYEDNLPSPLFLDKHTQYSERYSFLVRCKTFNVNNFRFTFPEERFSLENYTNLNHPSPCTSCAWPWQPAQCCSVTQRAGPQCWSPFSQLPLTDLVKTCLTTSILLSFTVFTAVWFCVWCEFFFPHFLYPFHSLVFCSPSILPSLPPFPPTSMPTSLLVLQGAGAVLVLLLCLPRTDVQEIPAQWEKRSERERERKRKRRSTWRQIRWTVGSAGAVWKCGIPFRDLKSCVAKLKVFVFLQHLGLLIFFTYKVLNNKGKIKKLLFSSNHRRM